MFSVLGALAGPRFSIEAVRVSVHTTFGANKSPVEWQCHAKRNAKGMPTTPQQSVYPFYDAFATRISREHSSNQDNMMGPDYLLFLLPSDNVQHGLQH